MPTMNKRSPIWKFFEINSENKKYAVCLLCGVLISRGGERYKAGTSALNNHLKLKHPMDFKAIKKEKITEIPSSPVPDVVPDFLDTSSPVTHQSHHKKRSRSGVISLSKLLKSDTDPLMELERRRVEVEEKLAKAALITAEASRIQAEASRLQAEAMVNLVKLLENKSNV